MLALSMAMHGVAIAVVSHVIALWQSLHALALQLLTASHSKWESAPFYVDRQEFRENDDQCFYLASWCTRQVQGGSVGGHEPIVGKVFSILVNYEPINHNST